MAVTYRLRKQAVPYKTRLTGRLMSLRMRGSAHAGPLANLRRVLLDFLSLVPTSVPTIYSGPISTVKAQKESLTVLTIRTVALSTGQFFRLAPSETGCVLDSSAGANLARRSSRKTPPDVVTPLRQRRIKAAGRRNLGRHDGLPSREPNPCLLSKPRLSAPLAPGECSGSAKPRHFSLSTPAACRRSNSTAEFACAFAMSNRF